MRCDPEGGDMERRSEAWPGIVHPQDEKPPLTVAVRIAFQSDFMKTKCPRHLKVGIVEFSKGEGLF